MSSEVFIRAIGTAVPRFKIPQLLHHHILESANGMSRYEKIRLRKIYAGSGIDSRHSVLEEFGKADHPDNILFHPSNHHAPLPIAQRMELYDQHASVLCMDAARNCFDLVPGFNVESITHLVTFSCTGMSAPGLDIQLIEKLKLRRSTERTCINFMGCYAGINALKSAYHIVRSQPDAVVLLAGVELCTLHYQKNDKPDQVIANALFADGAACCLVSGESFVWKNNLTALKLLDFYAEFEPAGSEEMVWRIGNSGFDLKLSAYVPDLIRKNIHSLVRKLLSHAKVKQHDISYYAIHPGGIKILEACEEALSLSKQQNRFSYAVLREFGNMSSVTVFFVLSEYMRALEKKDRGKKMLSCAFGPGLTMEAMIAEVTG